MKEPIVHLGEDRIYVQWAERGEITVLHRDGTVSYQFSSPTVSDVCVPLRKSHLESVESSNRAYASGQARGHDVGHAEGYKVGYDEGYEDARHAHEGSEVA